MSYFKALKRKVFGGIGGLLWKITLERLVNGRATIAVRPRYSWVPHIGPIHVDLNDPAAANDKLEAEIRNALR